MIHPDSKMILMHRLNGLRAYFPLLFILALLPACTSLGHPQMPETDAAMDVPEPATVVVGGMDAEADSFQLDPEIRYGRLDNGLTYYVRKNTEPENRAELRLVVGAGSVNEDDDQLGLAHFVEHMLFNGTERFAEQEIVDFMERIGMRFGPDVNAYTSFDETVYMLQIPTDTEDVTTQAFQILSDWAARASFDPAEVDAERGVVIEEWRARMQSAQGRILEQLLPVLLADSRYEQRLPIGDPDIIRNADYDTIRRFYDQWYRPDLMAVVAVGDFDVEEIVAHITHEFAGIEAPADPAAEAVFPVPDHEETLYAVITDPEYPFAVVEVAFKTDVHQIVTTDDYRRSLLEQLFNRMLNQRLTEIAREPEAPFVAAQVYRGGFVRTSDFYGFQAQVHEDSLLAGLERVVIEAERAARHGFTETELERQKSSVLRAYELAFNERENTQSASLASEYVNHFLKGDAAPGIDYEYALVQSLLPGITTEDVNALADDLLDDANRAVVVTMPERDDLVPPTETQLRGVFEAATQREIAAYVDDIVGDALIDDIPQPGEIVAEERFESVDTEVFTLSNGVRVVFKPTDFRQDEVQMSAFSPGGHSLVSDDDYFDAANAAAIVTRSGVGSYTRSQLDRYLAGRVVTVAPFVSELEEGIRGSASPSDLETLFELTHLYFTRPRADSTALVAFQNQQIPFLRNRSAAPAAVFQDSLIAALYGDNVRMAPPTPEMVSGIDLTTAASVFEDRFADASDFTFVFVGNVTPERIRELAQTYLGSLPTLNRTESWRDVQPELPAGIVETTVHRGIGDQSQTLLIFHGGFDYNREARHRLSSLQDVLAIRLREDLRESRSAVYGVNVNAATSDRPRPTYQFSINFTSDPARVDELVDAVFDQIEQIKTDGPTDDELQRVKEQQRRERETQLQTNSFWLNTLSFYFRRDEDPADVHVFNQLVDSLTAEDIRATAARYLRTDQYVRGELHPETAE